MMGFTPVTRKINYELLKNSEIKFPTEFNENSIFHYTSIGGLQGILNYKTLRFTNIKYMNDKDEMIPGPEDMSKYINDKDEVIAELEGLLKKYGVFDETQKDILKQNKDTSEQIFVCCFSLEQDSLPMWNYYTKDISSQGYNIEFDQKQLITSILKSNPSLDGCHFSFGIMEYIKKDDFKCSNSYASQSVALFYCSQIKSFFDLINENRTRQLTEDEQDFMNKQQQELKEIEKIFNAFPLYTYLGDKCSFTNQAPDTYIPFVKRDCFNQEHEFRIVITVPNNLLPKLKDNNIYKFRISNGVMIPYLELKFSPEVIKSITISPTIQSDLVEQSIEDFLTYCDFKTENILIKHSNVPVRF